MGMYSDPKTKLLPNEAIIHAFKKLGVTDADDAIMELFSWGREDSVTEMEFIAVMLAMAGPNRSFKTRFNAIFQLCEFADHTYITKKEMTELVRAWISMRETLTIGDPYRASNQWNFSYAYTSSGAVPAPTRARKENRVKQLKTLHPEFKGTTPSEVLDEEAAKTTSAIFKEAKATDQIEKTELIDWASKGSKLAKDLMRLNLVFARAANMEEAKKEKGVKGVIKRLTMNIDTELK